MATKIWPEEVNEPWGRQRVTVVSSFPGILIFRPKWFPAVEGVDGASEKLRKFRNLITPGVDTAGLPLCYRATINTESLCKRILRKAHVFSQLFDRLQIFTSPIFEVSS